MGKIIYRFFFQAVCVLWELRREKKRNETSLYIYIHTHTHTRVLVVAGGPVFKTNLGRQKKSPAREMSFWNKRQRQLFFFFWVVLYIKEEREKKKRK